MASRDPSAQPQLDRKASGSANSSTGKDELERVELNDLDGTPAPLSVEDDLMQLARLGELRPIQKLFDSGRYNAKSTDEQGITALHWAAINGHFALCHFLIQSGADVNARGGDAEATPVLWASKKCNLQIVNLLLQNGANPLLADDQGYNLLHSATLDGNVYQLILLLHQPDMNVDVPDTQGHTSLMWAAYKGYGACIDVLLRWGADVHARDQMGFTALHWALVKGSYVCIQKLVEYGSDRFTRSKGEGENSEGDTPAMTAEKMKSTKQWHKALADSGFDAAGNPVEFPLPFIKDRRKFISRFFFFWPFIVGGCQLYILAYMVVFAAIPTALIFGYAMQYMAQKLLRWAPNDMKHVHKTPFLAGIFAGTLFWVGVRWLLHILPTTWLTNPFLNFAFLACYSLCTYFYFKTMASDPGFIPKGGSRGQQKAAIDELLANQAFDEKHFCTACMIRKPLRSKHCKRCGRCVAREDHHCPWVDNCIGVNNHKDFVLYTFFLIAGIGFLIRVTLAYVEQLPSPAETHCAVFTGEICNQYSKDPLTIVTNAWGSLQLTWVFMLVFVQLTQIARATTTYESMRGHSTGPVMTALATGSMTMEGAQISAAGAGPDAVKPAHNHQEGCLGRWKKLLGIDTFLAIALHGSKAEEVTARRKSNPFTRGMFRNCQDFWFDGPVFGRKGNGEAMLGGEKVDYTRMYVVPRGGMRYRGEGYQEVASEDV